MGKAEAKTWFVSTTTPPADGLRLVLRNASQSPRIDKMPYTDRDYSQGSHSEEFKVAQENVHRTQALSVSVGENRFLYEIKRGKQIVESGEFIVKVDQNYRDKTRVVTVPRPKIEMPCVDKDKKVVYIR